MSAFLKEELLIFKQIFKQHEKMTGWSWCSYLFDVIFSLEHLGLLQLLLSLPKSSPVYLHSYALPRKCVYYEKRCQPQNTSSLLSHLSAAYIFSLSLVWWKAVVETLPMDALKKLASCNVKELVKAGKINLGISNCTTDLARRLQEGSVQGDRVRKWWDVVHKTLLCLYASLHTISPLTELAEAEHQWKD